MGAIDEQEHKCKLESRMEKVEGSLSCYLKEGIEFLEIPTGTELTFIKFGDESKVYSSDPVYANCYSASTDNFSFESKFLYTDPDSIWSFYNIK